MENSEKIYNFHFQGYFNSGGLRFHGLLDSLLLLSDISLIMNVLFSVVLITIFRINIECFKMFNFRIWRRRFGIILTQFYINFSRQEHQLELLYVSINSWDSQVSSNTFHFSFTVSLRWFNEREIVNHF